MRHLAIVVILAGSACVHRVDDPKSDGGALLVADGDDLRGQLAPDDDGFEHTRVIPAGAPFHRVGIRYDADGPVDVEVRTSGDGGHTFSPWQAATPTFFEERANNAFADTHDDNATDLQLRFRAPVESTLSFLAVEAFERARESSSSSTASQGLAADGVAVPRDQWGARAHSCSTPQTPTRITIHHTETPNNDSMSAAARLRQIQNYHVDVRGFCDIGYHFLVGQDGAVYQGRPEDLVGAHAGGANQNNVGVAFLGTYGTHAPNAAMMNGAATIMGALSREYDIALSRTTVKGHRDLGDTDCPGNALYAQLDALVAAAAVAASVEPGEGEGAVGEGEGASGEGEGVGGEGEGAVGEGEGEGGAAAGVYAGLTVDGAEIPRAGIANNTLRHALGVSVEPYGDVVNVNGDDFVRGTASEFGGPNDTGVSSTETGSVGGHRLRGLNTPLNASASTIASRPEDFYYCAMRWDYTPGLGFWRGARILIENPANGKQVVVRPEDWGPNTSTHRIVDLSPQTLKDLGAETDDHVLVSFASADAPLGVVAP